MYKDVVPDLHVDNDQPPPVTMSGFSPCVPFTPFAGVGGRGGPRAAFSEDVTRDLVEGVTR